MRVAVFSDVHGNLIALEAVLAAARAAAVEQLWVLGDLVADGPAPAQCLDRLRALPAARFVRGNTDRYVLTDDLSPHVPGPDQIASAEQARTLVDAVRSRAWTRGAICAVDGFDWLAALPPQERVTLPDGTRVLLVHASPGRDDGPGLAAGCSTAELAQRLATADADLVFGGHTHVPTDRVAGAVRAVNVGSVSLPATAERRAMWSLLVADEHGYTVEARTADYDLDAVRATLRASHHPSVDYLLRRFDDRPSR